MNHHLHHHQRNNYTLSWVFSYFNYYPGRPPTHTPNTKTAINIKINIPTGEFQKVKLAPMIVTHKPIL